MSFYTHAHAALELVWIHRRNSGTTTFTMSVLCFASSQLPAKSLVSQKLHSREIGCWRSMYSNTLLGETACCRLERFANDGIVRYAMLAEGKGSYAISYLAPSRVGRCCCCNPVLLCVYTDQPTPAVLELFGEHFFEVTSHSGHKKMLRTLGHDLYGFLVNLDYLHGRLSYTYEKMQAPSFMCEKTDLGLLLHYYSRRKGLHHIVVGIVKAAAKEFYSLTVE